MEIWIIKVVLYIPGSSYICSQLAMNIGYLASVVVNLCSYITFASMQTSASLE